MKNTFLIIVTTITLVAIAFLATVAVKSFKNEAFTNTKGGNMKLTSVFEHNEKIPAKYTCDGENISPELNISEVPQNTKNLVLIVDDPDAPMGTYTHWLLYNIPSDTTKITPDSVSGLLSKGALQGVNDFGTNDYGGPCPPFGVHRYFFKLFAIDSDLDIIPNATKSEIQSAIREHILEKTELIGLYSRK